MKLRLLLGLGAVLALGVVGSTARAAAPGAFTRPGAFAWAPGYTCSGGAIPGGTYTSLTVAGNCFFGGDVTVNGNVTVADGALLNDHAFSPLATHVVITGNVRVGKGAVLGLGTYNPAAVHDTTVYGNIVANQPLSLYLSFATVQGNVVSNGGGSGPNGAFRNFPTKDNTIHGNLVVQGWNGGWIGVIRNTVGGNVIFSHNASVVVETPPGCDPELGQCTGSAPGTDSDSSEVQTNWISGNLICQDNTPAAQVNALDGGLPNVVGGKGIGECAGLTG